MKIKTYKLLNSVGNEWCKINEENAKKYIMHTFLTITTTRHVAIFKGRIMGQIDSKHEIFPIYGVN